MKLPEDDQILGCNFILLHKFQHDILQEGGGGGVSQKRQNDVVTDIIDL